MFTPRQWLRFPSEYSELVLQGALGKEYLVEPVDESFGGIGLLLSQPHEFQVGDRVSIVVGSHAILGEVTNIAAKYRGDRDRIGVRWTDSDHSK